MNKEEFLPRFTLHALSDSFHHYQHPTKLRQAAVLIGLVEPVSGQQGLQVLLTKRASHLKHHPSQISFPGGKVEATDNSLIDAALREAHEEVGLTPDAVNIIGQLNPYQTVSGFEVTPIVAIVDKAQHYDIDENEVAEVFLAPLQHFLTIKNAPSITVSKHGHNYQVHSLPYLHHNIWGATAVMLKDLTKQISYTD